MNDTTNKDTGPELGASAKPETQRLIADALASAPTTPEELLDSMWDRLGLTATEGHGTEIRYISRDQLAEFLTEASLLAIDDVEAGGARPIPGPLAALLQSLKVMGDLRGNVDGAKGHQMICQRAVQCLEGLANDVTRFLAYPGCVVKHATLPHDLSVVAVRFLDDGRTACTCRVAASAEGEFGQWVFPLSELNSAGPVDDAVRVMVARMMGAFAEDAVAQLVAQGGLHRMAEVAGVEPVAWARYDPDHDGLLRLCAKDAPAAFPVFGAPPEDEVRELVPTVIDNGDGTYRMSDGSGGAGTYPRQGVDHLQAHPEYVMEPGGAHAEPADNELTNYVPDAYPPSAEDHERDHER